MADSDDCERNFGPWFKSPPGYNLIYDFKRVTYTFPLFVATLRYYYMGNTIILVKLELCVCVIITLPLKLSASGRRINIIMLTSDTSFQPYSVSLYLSLPRKLI